MMKNPVVSICVAMYNSDLYKTLCTIESILQQNNIQDEIIVADDGSINSHYKEIEKYFAYRKFENYKFVPSVNNNGTVINIYNAVSMCNGKYVKFLSPGDWLYGDVLYDWYKCIDDNNAVIAFTDTVFYRSVDNTIKIITEKAMPRNIKAYKRNGESLKKDYLLNTDLCVGCSILSNTQETFKYLQQIVGKVKYLEDSIYALMIYDNARSCYYDNPSILYEFGSGISTRNNGKQDDRLGQDWLNVFDIFENYFHNSPNFDRKIERVLKRRDPRKYENQLDKVIRYLGNPEEIIYRAKENFNLGIRKTPDVYYSKYINNITATVQNWIYENNY